MDEKALEVAYRLFVKDGYNKSIGDFKTLISTNPKALDVSHKLFVKDGYNGDISKYKNLLGVGELEIIGTPEIKKKEQVTELPSTDGSLGSENATKPLPKKSVSLGSEKPKPEAPIPNINDNSYGDVQPKPLEFRPFVKDKPILKPTQQVTPKQDLQNRLKTITPELIGKEEKFVVPELNYQFKDQGFKFEEATPMADAMNVTAPNGKVLKIDLDPFTTSGEVMESNKLKKFISENSIDYDKINKVSQQQSEYKKRFIDQKEIESANQRFNDEIKLFDYELQQLNLLQKGTPEYTKKANELAIAQNKLISNQKELNKSAGKYVEMKESQGTYLGYLRNQLIGGITGAASGLAGLVLDVSALPDAAKKQAKNIIQPGIRESLDYFKDETTKEYAESLNFVGEAIGGLVQSLPAMLAGEGLPLVMAGQISDGLDQEMKTNPDFENVSELEKLALKTPMIVGGALLEKYGLRNVVQSRGLLNNIVLNAVGKSTQNTTVKSFEDFLEQEIKDKFTRGVLKVGAGGLAEFETGASQELLDITTKDIYNAVKEKKMFQTPETFGEKAGQVFKAGLQEAIGGFILSVPSAISASKGDYTKLNNATIDVLKATGNDATIGQMIETDLKMKVNSGDLTPDEAETQLNDFRESVGVLNSINTEGMTPEQMKRALPIAKKLRDLKNRTDGKVNQTEADKFAINELKVSLDKITNEVKDQTPVADLIDKKVSFQGEEGVIVKDEGGKLTFETPNKIIELQGDEMANAIALPKIEVKGNNVKIDDELFNILSTNKNDNGDVVSVTLRNKEGQVITNKDADLATEISKQFKNKKDAIQEQTTEESVLRNQQPEMGLQEMGEGDTQKTPEQGKTEEEVGSVGVGGDVETYFNENTRSTQDSKYNPDLSGEGEMALREQENRLLELGADRIQAHGLAKGSIGQQFKDLINILTKGLDSRGGGQLYTAPLVMPTELRAGAGAALGTGGGTAYTDGGFIILAREGVNEIRSIDDIGGVLVNQAVADSLPELVDRLKKQFPNISIESYSNSPKAIESIKSKAVEQSLKEAPKTEEIKPFSIGTKTKFYHATPSKVEGKLTVSNAPQFGTGIYLASDKKTVEGEFGDNVMELELNLSNPVYTNTKNWNEVESEAIRLADEEYGKKNNLTLGEDDTYFRYDPENLSEIDEIPSKHISDAAKKLGYDAIIDKGSRTYGDEIVVLDESKIIYPKPIKKQNNETENGIQKRGTQGNENVPSEVQSQREKRREDVNVPESKTKEEVKPTELQTKISSLQDKIETIKKGKEGKSQILQKIADTAISDLQKKLNILINKQNEAETKAKAKAKKADVLKDQPKSAVVETAAEKVKSGSVGVGGDVELKYNDKGEHLAPNGKPSKLSEQNAKLVRTPEFKAWFGDWENDAKNASKVVDENGEPLVVWHGTHTKKEFEKEGFDTKKGESYGTHFGTKKSAEDRLKDLSEEMFYEGNPRLIPVFLDIKNPIKLNDYNLKEYKKAEKDGHDGVIYTNEVEDKGSTGYSIFDPNKIKTVKAVEQSLKETPKAETPKTTSKTTETIELEKQLEEAQSEIAVLSDKIKTKSSELGKTFMEGQANLFGQRKSDKDKLLSQRVNPDNIKKVISDLKKQRDIAILKTRKIQEKIDKSKTNKESQRNIFESKPATNPRANKGEDVIWKDVNGRRGQGTVISVSKVGNSFEYEIKTKQGAVTTKKHSEIKKKGIGVLANTIKKYSNLDVLTPRTLILRYFATGGKVLYGTKQQDGALSQTGYAAEDLFGFVSKNGRTYSQLYENIMDELQLEDFDQGDFNTMVSEILQGGKQSVYDEIKTHLVGEEKDLDDPTFWSYNELLEVVGNENFPNREWVIEQIGEMERAIADELSPSEIDEAYKNIEKYTIDGVIDWDAIANDKEIKQLNNEINEKQDTKTESTASGDSTPISQEENDGQQEIENIKENESNYILTPNKGLPFLSESGNDNYPTRGNVQREEDNSQGYSRSVIGVWNKTKDLQFTGTTKVRNAEDVAHIMRLLENKNVEHGFAVHVDAKGNSHIQYLSVGGTTGTVIDSRLVLAGLAKFKSKKVYLVHNHPSGALVPSKPDISITQTLQSALGKLDIDLEHVIMDTYSNKYVLLDKDADFTVEDRNKDLKDNSNLTVYAFNEQKVISIPQTKVTSSKTAAEFIQQLRFTAMPKNAMLLLSQNNDIIGNYVFKDKITYQECVDFIGKSGIGTSVIFYGNQQRESDARKVSDFLKNMSINVLDHIITDSNGSDVVGYYRSLGEEGMLGETQAEYGTNSVKTYKTNILLPRLIKNTNVTIKKQGVKGKLLNEQEAKDLKKEIISKRAPKGKIIFGQGYLDDNGVFREAQDIRSSMFNYDNPYASKNINGIDVRIADGLIRKNKDGKKYKTYLLYADGKIVGEFNSVADAKSVVGFIEDNLVKELPVSKQKELAEQQIKELSARIRSKKLSGIGVYLDFGITKTIYNGALEIAAREIEKGSKLGNAINKAIAWVDKATNYSWSDRNNFIKHLNTIAYPKGIKWDNNNHENDVASDKIDINNLPKLKGGTTRDVYDLGDKVLKIAKNPKGIEQNNSMGFGDVDLLSPYVPEIYEQGKDYIVTEKVPRNDKNVRKFLLPLQKFSARDFSNKNPKLQDILSEMGLSDFENYNLLWNDFISARNWGQRENGDFVLIDEGALNDRVTFLSKPDTYAVSEWDEIKQNRKTAPQNAAENILANKITPKEQSKQRIEAAKKAFIEKSKNMSSGGFQALPEFVELIKSYIADGIITAQEFIERFKDELPGIDLNEKLAVTQFDKIYKKATTVIDETTEEVKKTIATSRVYEGNVRAGVKRELEKLGLTRDVENQQEAKERAIEFVDTVGIETALEAVRNNDVSDAAGAYVWNEILERLDRKISKEKDPKKLAELEKEQAGLFNEFSRKALSGGRFSSALADIYQNSDIGYNVENKIQEYRNANNGQISEEVEEKFRELDAQYKEVKQKLAEAEERATKAEGELAIKNIQEAAARTPKQKVTVSSKIRTETDWIVSRVKEAQLNRPGMFLSATPASLVWDGAVKIVAGTIKVTGRSAEAIAKGLEHIVKSDWYKSLSDSDKKEAAKQFSEFWVNKETIPGIAIKIPNGLIRRLVEEGATTIEEVVEGVKDIIKEEYPDITDREIRDAITQYGKIKNLSKDEILASIRKIKRIGRIVSALEDVNNKKRPLRSGLQRDKLDAQERALNKELRELMKELPIDAELEAKQQKTALDATKQRITNQIEDLQREIDKGMRVPLSKRSMAEDAELTNLKEKRDKLKIKHNEIFKDESFLQAKRLDATKKASQRAINDLRRRLKEKDFTKKEKSPLIKDSELLNLQAEKLRLREEYDKEIYKAKLNNRTKAEKTIDTLWNAWGLTRLLRATGEFSFVGIQGLVLSISNPTYALKSFATAMKFFGSESKTENWLNMIKSQEWYPEMRQSKLSISEPRGEATAREELFLADAANFVWNILGSALKLKSKSAFDKWKNASPFKAFERAAVGYLDTMRVLKFLDGREMLHERGIRFENDPQAFKDLADVVNTFTGRASIGPLEQIAPTLTKVFFSPRNWASALKQTILFPRQLYKWRNKSGTPGVSIANKIALLDYSKFIGLTMGLVTAAAMYYSGDDDDETGVETDPTSSDFGKIKIGNTRVDPWGGRIQQIVFLARIIAGSIKNGSGEVVKLGTPYRAPTRLGLIGDQAVNKLAPSAAMIQKFLTTHEKNGVTVDQWGNPYSITEELKKNAYPIYWDTVKDLLQDDPTALDGLLTFYAFFGGGVNVYDKKTKPLSNRPIKELKELKEVQEVKGL